jgi:hypothetical protein
MIKKTIVVTTISGPKNPRMEKLFDFSRLEKINLVIIGDRKTPAWGSIDGVEFIPLIT